MSPAVRASIPHAASALALSGTASPPGTSPGSPGPQRRGGADRARAAPGGRGRGAVPRPPGPRDLRQRPAPRPADRRRVRRGARPARLHRRRLRERSLGVLEGTARNHRPVGYRLGRRARHRPRHQAARPGSRCATCTCAPRSSATTSPLACATAVRLPLAGARRIGRSTGGDVLVIAHGGTVRVLDAYLHGVAVDQMAWRPVGNAAIVRIPEFGSQPRGGNR